MLQKHFPAAVHEPAHLLGRVRDGSERGHVAQSGHEGQDAGGPQGPAELLKDERGVLLGHVEQGGRAPDGIDEVVGDR